MTKRERKYRLKLFYEFHLKKETQNEINSAMRSSAEKNAWENAYNNFKNFKKDPPDEIHYLCDNLAKLAKAMSRSASSARDMADALIHLANCGRISI